MHKLLQAGEDGLEREKLSRKWLLLFKYFGIAEDMFKDVT
jgi:hypothetical protein